MNLSRRRFAVGSLFLPLGTALNGAARSAEQQPKSQPVSDAQDDESGYAKAFANGREQVVDYHRKAGYRHLPGQSLITGQAFNGGLRYDDSGGLADAPDGAMVIQVCARVEDLQFKERQEVLPYFHLFACNRRSDSGREQVLSQLLDLLVTTVGLPVRHLGLVSVSALEEYRSVLAEYGIDWDKQVSIRDLEQAKAAGDGSGYFRPEGHPEKPEYRTAGLYFWMGDGPPPDLSTYPPPKPWVEIGEVVLEKSMGFGYGLGLERLVYAQTRLLPGWRDGIAALSKQARMEAEENGMPLPEGYYQFEESAG
ncbi:MAG: hypothetical protein H6970_09560 [Gammaproteobacteria bacterium]|nr:hypothetical protein [Gammaproteobacteria bacterium]